MSTRSTVAAALASLGVLGIGWNAATADGHTLSPISSSSATSTTPTASTPVVSAPGASAPAAAEAAPAASTAVTTAPATTAPAASATGLADGTYTGAPVTHRFGSVTVTVTVAQGRISALTERVVGDGDRHSATINARSVPTLRSAILAAGDADVATVSGATYTTRAYLASLQSALDQATR